jgi:hypothetical protein
MDTVLSYFLAMPDWIQLGNLIRRYEKICEALDGYAILGALYSHGIQQKYELQMYLRVLRELAAHGFDEVLCYRVGEEVDVKPGWLPVKGDDFHRVVSAFKQAGVDILHLRSMDWWRQQTLRIVEIGEDLYVEIPVQPVFEHKLTLVKLYDGRKLEKLTSDIEIYELGESELEALRNAGYQHMDVARYIFKAMSPPEYLRLAGRICYYAAEIYDKHDYPIQTLNPYVEDGVTSVLVMRGDIPEAKQYRMPGRLKGDINQYDPLYCYVSTLHRETSIVFNPNLERFSGRPLLDEIYRLALAGELIYKEPEEGGERRGSGVYSLNTSAARNELVRLIGESNHRVLREVIMPRLGEELYLVVVGGGGRGVYELCDPPTEYVPTALLARAMDLDGEIMNAIDEAVEAGAPEYLLTIESGWTMVEKDWWFRYALAVVPRKISLNKGVYFDEDIRAGVVSHLVDLLTG